MKKVCVITSIHSPYDGRIYHKQCKSLKRAGYDVVLIAPEPEVQESEDIPLITFKRPSSIKERILSTLHLYKLAKNTKADIYHFHDPELMIVGVLIEMFLKKPVIYDVHEHYPNTIMGREYIPSIIKVPMKFVYIAIEKLALMKISGVIYTTEEIGHRYSTYNGCKIENYPLKEMFPEGKREKDPDQLIYLGGITKIRGVLELLNGFSQAVDKAPQARLLFLGSFESDAFKEEVYNLIAEKGIEENVTFISRVPYEQISSYVDRSSIGILPYLPYPNHLVALPNKLFEYMAASNAIIASHFPHYKKVIENSRGGLVIDPEDSADIAAKITQLLNQPNETAELGENARKAFENKYNWSCEEKKLLEFYHTLLRR
ncbi:glycosyltransferase family 4 protein [Pseudalkalibacillus hwajinpoensis]|uniref:Glycosyltransferase family 4 protein n=1 Tax=Guptibacillus hwajinpoensis TaxID=208199 RepID=A0A4U1MKM7_9BACL|nr:glycosyltransferase family 4 protein [Pseudalkalibacillus hwajinpoensis]TKD70980.1 glycosyltransferase family 4 protein [Pseudalkalibacillus hwajinpoensis]